MWNGFVTFVLGMHAGIEDHPGACSFQQIGIRTDSGVATETFKDHEKRWDKQRGQRMRLSAARVNPPACRPTGARPSHAG